MDDGSGLIFNLILWFGWGALIAALANSKGRNAVGWFFLGLIFPCISLILVLCLPNLHEQQQQFAYHDSQNRRLQEQLRQERMKNQAFQASTQARLDEHDTSLGIDTRQAAPALVYGGGAAAPPSTALPGPAAQWYYSRDGQKDGPHAKEYIESLISAGTITAETLIWDPVANEWKAAGLCTDLASHFW